MQYGSIPHTEEVDQPLISTIAIGSILSTAFAYGCTMTTFFLLVLPLECRRIEAQIIQISSFSNSSILQILGNKSVALSIFAVVAGLAQLISPLIGLLSDNYIPPIRYRHLHLLGKRLPYIFLGTFFTLIGVTWEFISSQTAESIGSYEQLYSPSLPMVIWPWLHYLIAFAIHNLGLNIVYSVMMSLIPDLVPSAQIGQANGTFALLVVLGSLFGFAIFQTVVSDGSFFNMTSSDTSSTNSSNNNEINILGMYKIYLGVSAGSAVLTYHFVMQRLHQLRKHHHHHHQQQQQQQSTLKSTIIGTVITQIPESRIVQTNHLETTSSSHTTTNSNYLCDHHQPLVLNHHSNHEEINPSHLSHSSTSNWPPIHLIIYFLLYEPIAKKSMTEIRSAYWIESTGVYHDFFVVTLSRLFYYMGISSQTFFLYYVHDVVTRNITTTGDSIHNHHPMASVLVQPEVTVAVLAIIAQISGAFTCYPVGILSDKYFGGRRKPFVYLSCLLLCIGYLSLLLCTTLNQIMGICILLGASNGMYLTMDTSLAVDTLPSQSSPSSTSHEYSYEVSHEDDMECSRDIEKSLHSDPHGAAQLLGVWGVFGFIGSSLGPLVGGIVLFILGKPNDTSLDYYYSTRGYAILFSLSACYFFCAALSLTFIQKKGV